MDPCNLCRIRMNDIQVDYVIIYVHMDGVDLDGTNTDGYCDPSEAAQKELFLTAAFHASSSIITWDG